MKRREFILKGGLASLAVSSTSILEGFSFLKGTNDVVNIGIIGTGSRGNGLIPIINEMKNLNVVACCDILPFRLEEGIARTNRKAKAYENYLKLLENKDVDAVIVATPFSTHSDIEIDALDSGKHVYGEKTLAKGYNDIENLLVSKANAPKSIFQTGHQLRCSRLHQHVVNLIKNGKIGKVASIDCQYNRNGDWRRPVPNPKFEKLINWRMYREYSGGLLAELSSHHIDLANWVLDSAPEQVMGTGSIDYWKDGRETYDNIHLIYSYPSGVKAKYTCLTTNALDGSQIKILGSKGTIVMNHAKAWYYPEGHHEKEHGEVDGVSGATVQWEKGKGIPIEINSVDPSKQALTDFMNSIFNNKNPTTDILSGAKTAISVQMGLDAMYNNKIVKWKPEFNLLLNQA